MTEIVQAGRDREALVERLLQIRGTQFTPIENDLVTEAAAEIERLNADRIASEQAAERTRELESERDELRMLLARYGDRVRMANASVWQQTIDNALEGRCPKCGGLHLGMPGDCMGPPRIARPPRGREIA